MSDWHDKTGGMAFPTLDNPGSGLALREVGMTLRSYFAAKAMQALIQNGVALQDVAAKAYIVADSMIAEDYK